MERLLETISYEASDRSGAALVVDRAYVDASLGKLAQDEDLARYIL
jgi:ATP-dependent HslUV protease ATP-binding subunit HslU